MIKKCAVIAVDFFAMFALAALAGFAFALLRVTGVIPEWLSIALSSITGVGLGCLFIWAAIREMEA